MSRMFFSLGAIAAALTLVLGATEVQAKHCRTQYSNCYQSGNYSYTNATHFNHHTQRYVYYTSQPVNYGCHTRVQQQCQPTYYTSATSGYNQQTACGVMQSSSCNVRTAYSNSEIRTNSPAPAPPQDNQQAPAPDRAPAPAPDSSPAPKLDSAPAPTPAPGR